MNISEFERMKPKETYKEISDSIEKYKNYIREIDPIMDSTDEALIDAYVEVLADLKFLKNKFTKGL